MATIRVGKGMLKLSFEAALKRSKPGDVIVVEEGDYDIGGIWLGGATIVGAGDPRQTVLRGWLEIKGSTRISNLSVIAQPFHNAVNIPAQGVDIHIENCVIYGDPAHKYPAIYGDAAMVTLERSTIVCDPTVVGVNVVNGGQLQARSSDVSSVVLIGSKAFLTEVRAMVVRCHERSQVEANGHLVCNSADTQRALVVQGESSCRVQRLVVESGPGEALCDEGFIELGQVDVPDGGPFRVVKKGQGVVNSASPAVAVIDPDQPAEPPQPEVVVWKAEDARDFGSAVAPHLNPGDTILLEEGDYYLDGYENGLVLGVDISGQGAPENTCIHGTISVMKDHGISISNLTLRPEPGRNALLVPASTQVTASNVLFDAPEGSTAPVVYASGRLTMSGCQVIAGTTSVIGVLDIDAEGQLHTRDSWLGWLVVEGRSSAELVDSGSFQVLVYDNARISSSGTYVIGANDCNQRMIVVDVDSSADFEAVAVDSDYAEFAAIDSSLRISKVISPEAGEVSVVTSGRGTADVTGDRVFQEHQEAYASADGEQVESEGEVGPVPQPVQGDDGPAGDPIAELMSMTGLTTVKEQIQSFIRTVEIDRMRRENGLKTRQTTMHSLFLGNPGTGKTTVARLMGRALYNAGAVKHGDFFEVGRSDLVGKHIGESALKTEQVLEKARGGVLFIDEAYSLHQENNNEFAQEAVDTLLAYMENHRDDLVVIFAGYTEEMEDFLGMNPGMKSRVPHRFDFEDYSPAEIAEIGYQGLLDADYTVNDALYRDVVASKYARSADRSNGRWVRNFNQDLSAIADRRIAQIPRPTRDDLVRITDEDLRALMDGASGNRDAAVSELLEQLDRMIGLRPVKDWVRHMVNEVKFDRGQMESGGSISESSFHHMIFTGNPGTGKTTVARIIGRLFYNLGVLSTPTVREVRREDLVGAVIGETEKKTSRVLDEAMGGVLFIDEAYTLYEEQSSNDFGKKAIETLLPRLENDRDKFVTVFAGYSDEMERFLSANPGLRSRIPLTIEFPDYTPEEVGELVVLELEPKWDFNRGLVAAEAARRYAELDGDDPGNGRWARYFAQRIASEQKQYAIAHGVTGVATRQISDALILNMGD